MGVPECKVRAGVQSTSRKGGTKMKMIPMFFRKKNLIIVAVNGKPAGGETEHCKSINAAKRKSTELQKANGGLGSGSVSVIR